MIITQINTPVTRAEAALLMWSGCSKAMASYPITKTKAMSVYMDGLGFGGPNVHAVSLRPTPPPWNSYEPVLVRSSDTLNATSTRT